MPRSIHVLFSLSALFSFRAVIQSTSVDWWTRNFGDNEEWTIPIDRPSAGMPTPKVFVMSNAFNDHWTKDGIDLSTKLNRTYDPLEADAWVVNMGDNPCDGDFPKTVFHHMRQRIERATNHSQSASNETLHTLETPSHDANVTEKFGWKIFLMDSYDGGYKEYAACLQTLGLIVGYNNLYYSRRLNYHQRRIKHHRKDPEDKEFSSLGYEARDEAKAFHNGEIRILRFGVRTDFAEAVHDIVKSFNTTSDVVPLP
jgi:hypothetical protein